MQQYHALLKEILSRGDVQFDPRTEEFVIGISAWQSVYDLRKGFPLVTTKEVNLRLPIEELFWKLRGERNVKPLVDGKVKIWTANAFDHYLKKNGLSQQFPKHSSAWNEQFKKYEERIKTDAEFAKEAGDLGPVYGYQMRHWTDSNGNEVDQLKNLLASIREKPGSRYHIMNSWNVGDIKDMAIGPCPFWHQFSIYGRDMDLTMVQRSCDSYLGVPFNIAQDSMLLKIIAKETGYTPRFFNHSYVNTHIYLGVPPRSDFWLNPDNVAEFQDKFKKIEGREGYLGLKEWYNKSASAEREGSQGKDHVPFVLEQLSKEPLALPSVEIINQGINIINGKALEHIIVNGYNFHKWDHKAVMAA